VVSDELGSLSAANAKSSDLHRAYTADGQTVAGLLLLPLLSDHVRHVCCGGSRKHERDKKPNSRARFVVQTDTQDARGTTQRGRNHTHASGGMHMLYAAKVTIPTTSIETRNTSTPPPTNRT